MLREYDKFYIQRVTKPILGLSYTINKKQEVVGSLHSKPSLRRSGGLLLGIVSSLLLSNRYYIENLDIELFDKDGSLLGTFRKDLGLKRDLLLYSKTGEHLATISSNFKMKSSKHTVLDTMGKPLLEANSGYGATDFSVLDPKTSKTIATIRKRSLIYETAKESIFNNDVYHIENIHVSDLITFALIGMVVATDINFFY